MNIFLSKYINKIDKKGRVSIPAGYRGALAKENFNGIIVYPSFKNNFIMTTLSSAFVSPILNPCDLKSCAIASSTANLFST